jgi:hypothetical protein
VEWMLEGRRIVKTELEVLKNQLKAASGHVRVQLKGGTKNIVGTSFAQNSLLATPCVVAIKKIKPRKRKNSSHVKGSERKALVAGMTIDLMKLTGKKWTKYPRIVCNVASAFTSEGFTSLTPAFLHSSRVISFHAKNSQSSMLSSACGMFSGAGSLSSLTPKLCARKFDASSPLKIAGTSIGVLNNFRF